MRTNPSPDKPRTKPPARYYGSQDNNNNRPEGYRTDRNLKNPPAHLTAKTMQPPWYRTTPPIADRRPLSTNHRKSIHAHHVGSRKLTDKHTIDDKQHSAPTAAHPAADYIQETAPEQRQPHHHHHTAETSR